MFPSGVSKTSTVSPIPEPDPVAMTKTRKVIFSLVCLAVLLAGAYFLFWPKPGPEKRINDNLDELVALAEKTGDESLLVTVGKVRDIFAYVSAEPSLELGPPLPTLTGKEEAEGILMQIRQNVDTLAMRIVSRNVAVAADERSARMEVEVEGRLSYAGESGRERRKFEVEWVNEEDRWVVRTVRLVGTLRESSRF